MSSEDAPEANENQEVAVEETEETESQETDSQEDSASAVEQPSSGLPDDPETLKREIAKLRRENAAKRTKSREQEEAAKKWQEHVESQKSDLEKLQDQVSVLTGENKTLKLTMAQRDLAKEYGVDDDLAEFIVGDDLDEMTEKAKKLASKAGKKTAGPTAKDLRAGQGNSSVEAMSGSKWLRQLFNE